MLALRNTTDSLELVLATNPATQPSIYAAYRDIGAVTDTYDAGQNDALGSGTTPVAVVPAPAANVARLIDFVNVINLDAGNIAVTLRFNKGGTLRTLHVVTLAPNERLQYTDMKGFEVYANNGALKQTFSTGTNAATSLAQQAVLGADVTNNNAVANTMQDITGLAFPINAGQRVVFKFVVFYSAAATTTGARFSISGPTTSQLRYRSDYGLNSTTRTFNEGLSAYDQPAAANVTSPVVGGQNMAIVQGSLTATANGNVVARFASEVANSAIVALAGSYVEYQVI